MLLLMNIKLDNSHIQCDNYVNSIHISVCYTIIRQCDEYRSVRPPLTNIYESRFELILWNLYMYREPEPFQKHQKRKKNDAQKWIHAEYTSQSNYSNKKLFLSLSLQCLWEDMEYRLKAIVSLYNYEMRKKSH